VSYRLIDELQTKAVPVAQTCRLLGVSRDWIFEAERRAAAPMFCKASVHLRAAFMSSGQRCEGHNDARGRSDIWTRTLP